ncbi:thiosulfate sulfurtransferase/rhodanese-like domain-containing protein 3 [Ornithodoros turicata]|uniref:thiosulfate sulfurtransferase/rhodanese-like domain-containing protein 3 n=1 Tax=Ornithodoros turicata TaxID=34597 RepID=UPI0031395609
MLASSPNRVSVIKQFVTRRVKVSYQGITSCTQELCHRRQLHFVTLRERNAPHADNYHGPTAPSQLSRYCTDTDTEALDRLCVDFEEYKKLLATKDALLIDVREPKELVDDGRIPGTINIPLNDVGAAFELSDAQFLQKYGRQKPAEDDPNIVFNCRRGIRATSAMQAAHSKGYKQARFYRGSFCEWEEKGQEIIKG